MNPTAQQFADLVIDRLLARGCELLPDAAPAVVMTATEPGTPAPPTGAALADSVADASGEFARRHAAARGTDDAGARVLAAVCELGADTRREAELLREQARAHAAAVLPLTNTAAGMRLLVSGLSEPIGALQDRLEAVANANLAAADQLRELAGEYGPQPV